MRIPASVQLFQDYQLSYSNLPFAIIFFFSWSLILNHEKFFHTLKTLLGSEYFLITKLNSVGFSAITVFLFLIYFKYNIFKLNAFTSYTVFFLHLLGNYIVYMFMVTNSVSLQILEAEMASSWNLCVSEGLKYFYFFYEGD